MLSGIGDPEQLAQHDVPTVKALPGVGRNLQDRYEIGVVNRVEPPWQALRGTTYTNKDRQYRKRRRWRVGAYTSNGTLFSIMFPSSTRQERPDLFCFSCSLISAATTRVLGADQKAQLPHLGRAQGPYSEHRRERSLAVGKRP